MSESLAQANHASYQGINAQLKEARECRINRGNTVKRTLSLNGILVVIQECPELNQRSSVQDIEYQLALFIVQKRHTKLKGKNVLVLASGVGLLGIVAYFLGASVTLTESKELFPLIQKNLCLNNIKGVKLEEFECGMPCESSLKKQFFHYILLALDTDCSTECLPHFINTLITIAGNGTKLIIGYKRTLTNREEILKFRLLLGRYFDFSSSRSVIYPTDSGEIIILQIKRKPFSSFLENTL